MTNIKSFKDLFNGIQIDMENAQAYVSDGYISASVDINGIYLDKLNAIKAIEDDDERYTAGSKLEAMLEDDEDIWYDLYEASGYVWDERAERFIPYDQAVELMDDALREELHTSDYFPTKQDFFDSYCAQHLAKYGTGFEVN